MSPSVLVREAWSTARASRAYSIVFASIAFVAVFIIVLLSGQGEAQRLSVTAKFNQPEYRTVTISDAQGLGVIPWSMGERASGAASVETAWVLGPAFDVHNGALPDGGRISAKMYSGPWRGGPVELVGGRAPTKPDEALLDRASATELGVDATGGWVESASGQQWAVVGVYEPVHPQAPRAVLVPFAGTAPPLSVSFTVSDLSQVEMTAGLVASLAETSGPGQLTVDRSADAGVLQAAIADTVNSYGTMIVVSVMATSALSLTFLSVLMVHARRQEFGRRRALGATRGTVVALVVVQGAQVVTLGSLAGLVAALLATWLRFDVVVPASSLLLLLVTTVSGSALAQVPSAVAAGLRDPVRVLRTA